MNLYEQIDLLIKFACLLVILYVCGVLLSVYAETRAEARRLREQRKHRGSNAEDR